MPYGQGADVTAAVRVVEGVQGAQALTEFYDMRGAHGVGGAQGQAGDGAEGVGDEGTAVHERPHDRARVDWRESGLALMRCGTIVAAIRMSHDLIHAAAGTHDAHKIDAFLREALPGGGVFVDTARNLYFVLVQPSVGRRNEWVDNPDEQAKFLGDGSFLGVPSVRLKTRGAGRAYWCAPVEKAGEFVSQEAVSQLLAISRWRLAGGSCGSAALPLVSLPQRRRAGASQVEP